MVLENNDFEYQKEITVCEILVNSPNHFVVVNKETRDPNVECAKKSGKVLIETLMEEIKFLTLEERHCEFKKISQLNEIWWQFRRLWFSLQERKRNYFLPENFLDVASCQSRN